MEGPPPVALVVVTALLLALALWIAAVLRRPVRRQDAGPLASLVAGQTELLATTVHLAHREQLLGGPARALRDAAESYARELSATLDDLAVEIRSGIAAAPMPPRRRMLTALRDEALAVRALFLAGAAGRAGRALATAGPAEIDARLEALRAAVSELSDLATLVRR